MCEAPRCEICGKSTVLDTIDRAKSETRNFWFCPDHPRARYMTSKIPQERPAQYGSYKIAKSETDIPDYVEWAHNEVAHCAERIGAGKYGVEIIIKTKEDYVAMAGVDDELMGVSWLHAIGDGAATVAWKLTAYNSERPDSKNRLTEGVCPDPEE